MPFSETAAGISSRGTSSGTIARKAGATKVLPTPIAKVSASRPPIPTRSASASAASAAEQAATQTSETSSSRRRSITSASAPAGIASRKKGRLDAACTIDTQNGVGASDVISQAAPTFCIQVPTFDARPAIQSERKTARRSGDHGPGSAAGGAEGGAGAALMLERAWHKPLAASPRSQARASGESSDLQIPPLETREVAASQLQLAGRWCRVTFSGSKNKVRAALILYDGTRDTLSLEAH